MGIQAEAEHALSYNYYRTRKRGGGGGGGGGGGEPKKILYH